jgi:hypothetical protein
VSATGQANFSACPVWGTVRVTLQTSYLPEYITPTHKKSKFLILPNIFNKYKNNKPVILLTRYFQMGHAPDCKVRPAREILAEFLSAHFQENPTKSAYFW